MGTRAAIARDGLEIYPKSLGYCPYEWLDESGYADIDLARKFSCRSDDVLFQASGSTPNGSS